MKSYIGIDNGVTGTIGIVSGDKSVFLETPIRKMQDYTKKKKLLNRIDVIKLKELLEPYHQMPNRCMVIIERPMVNPQRWDATMSAVRALEATLCVLEGLKIPHEFIDSKEWQSELLPKDVKGNVELKHASTDIGIRMFPEHTELIDNHGDADGLLIAEYCRRKF